MNGPHYIPAWMQAIAGEREKAIINHPKTKFLAEDCDGNRLPNHQQWIESPLGTIWIDSQRKQIIG